MKDPQLTGVWEAEASVEDAQSISRTAPIFNSPCCWCALTDTGCTCGTGLRTIPDAANPPLNTYGSDPEVLAYGIEDTGLPTISDAEPPPLDAYTNDPEALGWDRDAERGLRP